MSILATRLGLAITVCLFVWQSTTRADEPVRLTGLADRFELGSILQDRNGDRQIDFVDAKIVLPNTPSAEEVAAAAAIAARLGFETSGISLPLVFHAREIASLNDENHLFLIGYANELLPARFRGQLDKLEDNQGAVIAAGKLTIVAGKDAAGTRVAGEAYASRSPYLWNIIGRAQGETFQRIGADLTHLFAKQLLVEVTIEELVYEKDQKEAVSVSVLATLENEVSEPLRQTLDNLPNLHRRGRETDRLNYASARSVNLTVRDSRSTYSVTLPRVGVPTMYLNPPRRGSDTARRGRGVGAGVASRSGSPQGRSFDLSNLYTSQGWLADDDSDRIPDNTAMLLVVPNEAFPSGNFPAKGATELAARIGLETTGLNMPFLAIDKEIKDASDESRPMILFGGHNRHVTTLARMGMLREDFNDGDRPTGRVEIVPGGLNGNSTVVITGTDHRAEEAAAAYLSQRAPFLWDRSPGAATVVDVKEAARKLLSARHVASQSALAWHELEQILEPLEDKEFERFKVQLFLEEGAPAFEKWLSEEIGKRIRTDSLEVTTQDRTDPVEVFKQQPELVWEVEAFWRLFREKVEQAIENGSRVELELRVSESPEYRRELAEEISKSIEARGGTVDSVNVWSAYKQGLLWLMESVVPAVESMDIGSIEIGWKPFPVEAESKQRFQNEPTRWLNELYPADDVLAQKLGLPLDAISFVARESDEIYTVKVISAGGEVVYEDSFSPTFYERPYFDVFPDYATVTVTTGWLRVLIDNQPVVDERIKTDSDQIWDHYQSKTLKDVHANVKSTTGGRAPTDGVPFFHTLKVELQLSEPDFELGIDQEHVSSLESLHDDIYFDTLDFFGEVARVASGETGRGRSVAAGTILPWIHPERRGDRPEMIVTYSQMASREAKLVVTYREKQAEEAEESAGATKQLAKSGRSHDPTGAGSEEKTVDKEANSEPGGSGEDQEEPKKDSDDTTVTKKIGPIQIPESTAYLAEVHPDQPGLARLGLLLRLNDTTTLDQVAVLLENLAEFQQAGMFPDVLAFSDVAKISIRLEGPQAGRTRTFVSQPAGSASREITPYGESLVTWDHVISPHESEQICHSLGTLPTVTTHVAGKSYQGRPISIMELKLPMEADLVSQAKLNTWKPVLSIIGRQHANEVSSTSHILRLAELLATDEEYKRYLHKMNVVIHPVVNPDGAALVEELQKLTPKHCLHAGRYSALGPDVSAGQGSNPDTLLTEALVLREVSNRWVADVYLNPHGYPTHEWVHQFANYNPKSFRSYWIPRGWWTSIRAIEDPKLAEYNNAILAIRDLVASEVSKDPSIRTTNLRIYDRYNRWAVRWQRHVYNLEVHEDTAIYHTRRGSGVSFARPESMTRALVFSGMTEAMDETAQGEWLDLVSQMGFGFLMASVKFLDQSEYELYRMEGESRDRVRLSLTRPRPIKPGGTESESN